MTFGYARAVVEKNSDSDQIPVRAARATGCWSFLGHVQCVLTLQRRRHSVCSIFWSLTWESPRSRPRYTSLEMRGIISASRKAHMKRRTHMEEPKQQTPFRVVV